MIAPGTRLGPYVINASIGTGGMGEVYRATDTNLKRAVAIKVLLPGGYAGRMYDISPDGERFALDATDSEAAVKQDRLVFVFNFFEELKRLVPT
jgi:serine/threonine protein kinase